MCTYLAPVCANFTTPVSPTFYALAETPRSYANSKLQLVCREDPIPKELQPSVYVREPEWTPTPSAEAPPTVPMDNGRRVNP
ncbi:hypothetical protein BELL_0146g00150 [Botrytis elliptica]|uniref:Uncharacterized protein n=1 Tax=Botrytis elliptica TaxID=278938 RepID=A0A4Z1JTK2_9HELO|nr:hypothetical protein BELL_0146g00150 [Botrytis elliptica]